MSESGFAAPSDTQDVCILGMGRTLSSMTPSLLRVSVSCWRGASLHQAQKPLTVYIGSPYSQRDIN